MTSLILAAMAVSSAQTTTFQGEVNLQSGRAGALAIVWLDGAEKAKPSKNLIIDQKDRTFIPHVSVTTVGSVVEFHNSDSFFHNVFADYEAKSFNAKHFAKGQIKREKLERPGLVALLCDIHAEMNAFIMVVDTPYHVVADAAGRFKIPNVPPGKYQIKVWHESNQRLTQPITITPNHPPVDLRVKRQ